MAKSAGIKGSVTLTLGEGVTVKEFTIPLDVKLGAYDRASNSATVTVNTEPFNTAIDKLRAWINAFPTDLNG